MIRFKCDICGNDFVEWDTFLRVEARWDATSRRESGDMCAAHLWDYVADVVLGLGPSAPPEISFVIGKKRIAYDERSEGLIAVSEGDPRVVRLATAYPTSSCLAITESVSNVGDTNG